MKKFMIFQVKNIVMADGTTQPIMAPASMETFSTIENAYSELDRLRYLNMQKGIYLILPVAHYE